MAGVGSRAVPFGSYGTVATFGAKTGRLTDEPASRGDPAIVSDKSFISVSSSLCGGSGSDATDAVPSVSSVVLTASSASCVSSVASPVFSESVSVSSSRLLGRLVDVSVSSVVSTASSANCVSSVASPVFSESVSVSSSRLLGRLAGVSAAVGPASSIISADLSTGCA